jgi:hypothetical protein
LLKSSFRDLETLLTGGEAVEWDLRPEPGLLEAIDRFLGRKSETVPFMWIGDEGPAGTDPENYKAVLETMSEVRALVERVTQFFSVNPQLFHAREKQIMSWKNKLENWFSAVAFAEEGEHGTALELTGRRPVRDVSTVTAPNSLTAIFAAAAFAEENCPDYAREVAYGFTRRKSFLEAIGLSHVRAWQGTAAFEQSFAETVGLAGTRCRMLAIKM